MKTSLLLLAALLISPLLAAEPLVKDSFSEPGLKGWSLTRGPWVLADGVATCRQDDALYTKYKNHGPVVWYDANFTDAEISFSVKPEPAVKTFVFTIDGADGHVFRFVARPNKPMLVKAFASEGQPEGNLDREGPPLVAGVWTRVTVCFEGPTAILKMGDYERTVSHPAIQSEKTRMGLGFSFGTLSLKDILVRKLE